MTDFTVNGKTYNDLDYSGSNLFGMGNGGFRVNWAPAMNDALIDFSASVAAAAAAAAAANATAGTSIWVSGTTYAIGNNRFSPTDFQTYRRKTPGAGTTDPKNDPTNWSLLNAVGDHEVTVHSGNGYGSTNTVIRRYTTILRNVGTAITYADSATLGASFTINEPGMYEIYTADSNGTGAVLLGASLNIAGTTDISNVAIANRLIRNYSYGGGSLGTYPTATRTVRLAVGDVIRPHQGVNSNNAANDIVQFSIRKVGL